MRLDVLYCLNFEVFQVGLLVILVEVDVLSVVGEKITSSRLVKVLEKLFNVTFGSKEDLKLC